MLNTHTTARPEGPITVKVDPVLERMRKARKFQIAGIGMLFIAAVLFITGFIFDRSAIALPYFSFLFILLGFSSLTSIFSTTLQVRFWKRTEQRRQTAARGDQSLLAAEQPLSDANALPLPTTIEQRPNWPVLLAIPGILIVLTFIFDFIMITIFQQTFSPHRPISPSALFIIGAAAIYHWGSGHLRHIAHLSIAVGSSVLQSAPTNYSHARWYTHVWLSQNPCYSLG